MLDHMLTRIENAQADGATYLALYSPAGVQIDSLELQDISAINDDLGDLRAEIAALRARLEAVRAALGPALEAEAQGATAAPWRYHPSDPNYSNAPQMVWGPQGPGHGTVAQTCSPGMSPERGGRQARDAALITILRNALPALRAALESEAKR